MVFQSMNHECTQESCWQRVIRWMPHIVIGVSDSGLDAALGYANKSGIPYGMGLIKNKYIGRTFISPGQNERLDKVRIKLSPVKNVIDGKRVISSLTILL